MLNLETPSDLAQNYLKNFQCHESQYLPKDPFTQLFFPF